MLLDAREIDREVENTEREGECVDECNIAVFPRTKANITRELVVGFLCEYIYEYNIILKLKGIQPIFRCRKRETQLQL